MNLLDEYNRKFIKDERPVLLATAYHLLYIYLPPNHSQLYAATSNDNHHANEQYCNKMKGRSKRNIHVQYNSYNSDSYLECTPRQRI